MSVGALVTFRQAEPRTEYLPLATESEFHRLWLPLANAHNLQWIPLFASGISLTTQDIPAVIEEFVQIQEAIATAEIAPEAKTKMLDRARRLSLLLETLDLENVEEVFIG
jgi:hypothetical protein